MGIEFNWDDLEANSTRALYQICQQNGIVLSPQSSKSAMISALSRKARLAKSIKIDTTPRQKDRIEFTTPNSCILHPESSAPTPLAPSLIKYYNKKNKGCFQKSPVQTFREQYGSDEKMFEIMTQNIRTEQKSTRQSSIPQTVISITIIILLVLLIILHL